MKKTVLSLATLLFASGMAFAGSDRFGSDYLPAADGYPATHSMVYGGAVDLGVTKSVTDSTAGENSHSGMPAPGYGQGIWGR